MDARSLSVVIVSWNVSDLLDRCLTSLRSELERAQVRASVWVLDNGSEDETPEIVQSVHPWVNLIRSDENLGFVEGNNRVMRRLLDGDEVPTYIWLLNPDTRVHPYAVERLIGFMNSHPRAGLAGPKLLNADGSLQMCAFRFPGVIQPLFDLHLMPERFYYSRFNGRYPRNWFDQKAPFRIDHPLGAAMFARAQAIRDVGLLDSQFFMYCEEVDWAWRMRNAGWSVWLVPEAEVTHIGGASTDQALPQTTRYLWQSRAKLYAKHRSLIVRSVVGHIVQRVFEARLAEADEPAWRQAYEAIIEAWK
jgi:N-acetylglucosaminyl-diphospho-decaprenol L-rhamnosyltransferase